VRIQTSELHNPENQTVPTTSRCFSFASHEIKIAPLVCLQNTCVKEMRITALRRFKRVRFGEIGSSLQQFCVIDKKVDPARSDIEVDHIAGFY
jgi:hypothetical protein